MNNNITFIEILGIGIYGTTYLIKYNNKDYALKIQNILSSDINKNFDIQIWRELDLYDYINTLKLHQQIFFTKLYKYEIVKNCVHKQIRPFKLNLNKSLKLKKYNNSNICIRYFTEYRSKLTLQQYLHDNLLSVNQTYSILLQICNIALILYEGGYSHNDLNTANIILNFTKKKTFKFLNKRIPFHGLQICAIDYGNVLHKKFGLNSNSYKDIYFKDKNFFLKNRKNFLFDEIYTSISYIIKNVDKYTIYCIRTKQKLPWEYNFNSYHNGIKLIINKQFDFFTKAKNKYIILYPKSKKLLYEIEKNINKLSINKIIKDKNNVYYFWKVIIRIVDEFRVLYPKLHSEYFNWCSYHICDLPEKDILDILLLTDVDELFNYLINKIK
jgi:hypothetical protein